MARPDRRPRIGINCDWRLAPREEACLKAEYLRSLAAAGALPLVLAPGADPDAAADLLEAVDGLVLMGGDDLDPALYGEAPHPSIELLAPVRQAWDLALARAADARGLPLLAVCCGLQLLNVVRGGTLVQDLPSALGTQVNHRTPGGPYPFHGVRAAAGSRVAAVARAAEFEVNSQHHQAVGRIGAGLTATAWAPDGVIEALEGTDGRFLLAVQWHPERLADRPEHLGLFRALAAAARGAATP